MATSLVSFTLGLDQYFATFVPHCTISHGPPIGSTNIIIASYFQFGRPDTTRQTPVRDSWCVGGLFRAPRKHTLELCLPS